MAGQPLVVLDAFTRGMVAAPVAPICAAMGFAAVLGPAAWFLAALPPWGTALLSGSGSGPILVFGQTFPAHASPARHPETLAALVCLGAAFGRTMSPVAAVAIYCGGLVGATPVAVVRRMFPTLLAGAFVAIATVLVLAEAPFRG